MTLLKSASKPKTQYRIAEQEVKLKAVVMFLRCGMTHTLPTSPNSDTRNQFLPVRVFHIWTVFNVLEFTVVTWPLTRMFTAMACCVEHKTVWGKDKSFFLICFLPPDCGEVKEGGEQGPCTWNTTFHEFLALHCTFPNEKSQHLRVDLYYSYTGFCSSLTGMDPLAKEFWELYLVEGAKNSLLGIPPPSQHRVPRIP